MHSLRLSLALALVCIVLYLVSSRFDSSRHIRCKRVIQKLLLPMSSSLFVLLLLFGRCNIDKHPIYGRTDGQSADLHHHYHDEGQQIRHQHHQKRENVINWILIAATLSYDDCMQFFLLLHSGVVLRKTLSVLWSITLYNRRFPNKYKL